MSILYDEGQLAIPEEFGGLRLSLIELGIVAQACGGPTAGVPFPTANDGAAQVLLGLLLNTIAEKILGLPQDYRPDKGVPFNRIRA